MTKVLVTGASGFIGRQLLDALATRRLPARAAVRAHAPQDWGFTRHETYIVGTIDGKTDWRAALENCDAVVHLAARVHVLGAPGDSEALYRETNIEGTRALARQSAAMGIKRFVFASTVKVHGEGRAAPYTEQDAPAPRDAYARSKQQAEMVLRDIATRTGMGATVLRIPLVYGPGVRGNFLRLMQAIDAGRPLPFGAVKNRRSLLYAGNLADAIVTCIRHPKAAQRTFLVSDGDDMSTPELVRRLARAFEREPRLVAVPDRLLQFGGRVCGKQAEIQRMTGTFLVDPSTARSVLGWTPPFSVADGLTQTAVWYKNRRGT